MYVFPSLAIAAEAFQCSSASRKFLNGDVARQRARVAAVFQCSSASRKFLNQARALLAAERYQSFSALQRAENSSIVCPICGALHGKRGFSALQRAENSSILWQSVVVRRVPRFSALQRAENSSMLVLSSGSHRFLKFQCSSASRKFLNVGAEAETVDAPKVSVLFSEPKIPQYEAAALVDVWQRRFQCSSASRKFLNPDPRTCVHPYSRLRRSRFVVPEPSWCVAMTPVY